MAKNHYKEMYSLAESMDSLKAEYNASKNSIYRTKRTGVSGVGNSADYHYRNESQYLRMMELARDFDRNDPVVGQGITRLVSNIFQQDGFRLDVNTGDEELDKYQSEKWNKWASNPDKCDVAQEHDFNGLAKLSFRSTVVDGDILGLGLKSGSLEMVEAHRVRTPRTTLNVVHGFLLNKNRKKLEAWVAKDNIDPNRTLLKVGDMAKVPIRDKYGNRNVFHVYNPKRVTQTRGVTALAPSVDLVSMHDDIQFAKLVQQQIASCFALIRNKELSIPDPNSDPVSGTRDTLTLNDGNSLITEGIRPGMEWIANPGETISGFSPNIPNNEFFKHAHLILTLIAINLGLPVAVLLLDPSNTNFSGWRGAIDQARNGFKEIQSWFTQRFYRPVYMWKVRQWIKTDPFIQKYIDDPDIDVFGHRWNPPEWDYIEPLKDASADKLILDNALSSPRRVHSKRGRDWDEVLREIVEDRSKAIEAAIIRAAEMNQKYPDLAQPLHWREFMPLPSGADQKIDINKLLVEEESNGRDSHI